MAPGAAAYLRGPWGRHVLYHIIYHHDTTPYDTTLFYNTTRYDTKRLYKTRYHTILLYDTI